MKKRGPRRSSRAPATARRPLGEPLRALAVFAGMLAVLMVLYAVFYRSGPMTALSQVTAQATGWLLDRLGQGVTVRGIDVSSPRFALRIVPECTAITPFMIYLAAVAAYRAPLRAKATGLLMGALGLFALNLARTVSLFFVGASYPDYVDFAHLVMWQSVMVIAALALWMTWARWTARPDEVRT